MCGCYMGVMWMWIGVAWDVMEYSKAEVERIVRVAADAAAKRGSQLCACVL